MKMKIVLGLFAVMGHTLLAAAQGITVADANEARQIRFAEQIIITGIAREKSLSFRKTREHLLSACPENEQCWQVCPEIGWGSEFAIDAIAIGKSEAAADALVNLLGLHLGSASSTSLNCQLFIRGQALSDRLERAQPKTIAERCQLAFHELKKRELRNVADVTVEQICRTEDEIRGRRDEMIAAIKSNALSDREECYHQLTDLDLLLTPVQNVTAAAAAKANETRQIRFFEQIVIAEMARRLSLSLRKTRESLLKECHENELCWQVCPEIGRGSELAIGTIAIGKSEAAADALINLLGLRLRDTAFREWNCQILIRGKALSSHLKRAQPQMIAEYCQSVFRELKKRELRSIADVTAELVCRTEDEIRSRRDIMLETIESKAVCDFL
jgi:NAD-dependent dihydropyrimidine dehydrogenase PreA subunit